jgi:hypothetical protein
MAFSNIDLYRASIAMLVCSLICAESSEASRRAIPIKQRLVEAVSTTRLCPRLHVNRAVFHQIARRQGLQMTRGSRDMRIFEQQVRVQAAHLLKYRRGVICGLGETDFGPRGIIVKGLLHVR